MVCCCDGDDQEDAAQQTTLTTPLLPPETLTISPMNSNFTPLICKDILTLIFSKLPVPDLARAGCVCRTWSAVASDRAILTAAFTAPWKLKEVVGEPVSGSFWRETGLSKFAISHCVGRGDSVASLAVKYSVQVMDIKRLNNMMSDHGIYSRERLLIPISNPDILVNATCYIEVDLHAKREVAVLYLEGGPQRKYVSTSTSRATSDLSKRVIESVRRSMQVDDEIARYYLSITDGDPRAALSEFSDDIKWERQTGLA